MEEIEDDRNQIGSSCKWNSERDYPVKNQETSRYRSNRWEQDSVSRRLRLYPKRIEGLGPTQSQKVLRGKNKDKVKILLNPQLQIQNRMICVVSTI